MAKRHHNSNPDAARMVSFKPFIAYIIHNCVNGKCYIGITSGSLTVRWRQHLYSSRCRQWGILGRAIAKYGQGSFHIREIASATTVSNLYLLEQILIKQQNTLRPHGYNLASGGGGRLNLKHTLQTRAKMSQARMGFEFSVESRAKMSASQKQRVVSAETRAKIGASHKGRKHCAESILRMSVAKLGNKSRSGMSHSLETRAKISAAQIGHAVSSETRTKMSEARKGVPLSAETKAKMSASRTGKRHTSETKAKLSLLRRQRVRAGEQEAAQPLFMPAGADEPEPVGDEQASMF